MNGCSGKLDVGVDPRGGGGAMKGFTPVFPGS